MPAFASVKGSDLPASVNGMIDGNAVNLERFGVRTSPKVGFEAPVTRYPERNRALSQTECEDLLSWSGREDLNLRPLGPEPTEHVDFLEQK
jgi:hypothetical protein